MTSIIVPVYNAERTLERCIKSLLNQSVSDFEVILVNDGSKDRSLQLSQMYAYMDKRIRIINKQNGGVSSARNAGIEAANGKYLMFVDADDFVHEDYIAAMLQMPESDLVYSGVFAYNDTTNKIDHKVVGFDKLLLVPGISSSKVAVMSNILSVGFPYGKLFMKEMVMKHNIRFDSRIRNHEDHLFCLDYLSHCKSVALTDKITYYWTYVNNSTSLSHRMPDYKQMIIASDGFLVIFENLFRLFGIRDADYISRLTSEYGIGTRRTAIYCMYQTERDSEARIKFLDEQAPLFRKWYKKYKYNPVQKKHLLVYFLAMMYMPSKIKDKLFCYIYKKS